MPSEPKSDQPEFTDKQIQDYLDHGGNQCPECHGTDVVSGKIQADSSIAWATVTCYECGAAWVDEYKLVSIRRD